MEWKESSTRRNCPLSDDLILHEILPKLPTKSLIRFKSLSRSWLSRISQHSSLVAAKQTAGEEPVAIMVAYYTAEKERTDRIFLLRDSEPNLTEIDTSYLWNKNPHPTTTGSCIKLIGSCNGLVCLQLWYDENWDLVLWNPATREVKYLPSPVVTPGFHERYAVYVLGFDPQTGDHKLVRLEEVDNNYLVKPQVFPRKSGRCDLVKAQVFSRKSGHWRELKQLSKRSYRIISLKEGLTVDGAIYWLVDTYALLHVATYAIIFFDVSKEEFVELEGPPFGGDTISDDTVLVKWNGSLGAIQIRPDRTVSQFWLKNDGNNCWTKSSTMDPSLRPLALSRSLQNRMLLMDWFHVINKKDEYFLYVLLELGSKVDGPLGNLHYSRVCHHFHTLVSPN